MSARDPVPAPPQAPALHQPCAVLRREFDHRRARFVDMAVQCVEQAGVRASFLVSRIERGRQYRKLEMPLRELGIEPFPRLGQSILRGGVAYAGAS